MNTDPKAEDKEVKWGYAFAGVLAIGIAAVVQFAFGDLDQETQDNLPAIFAIPYAVGGKLGLTVPLCVIGLCLILRDALFQGGGKKQAATSPRPSKRAARQEEEELEMGEPISEEAETVPNSGPVKIPAARGRFAGTTRPSGSSSGESRSGGGVTSDGQMVLTTAKYLNRKPGSGNRDFRKGKTNSTQDE